MFTEVIEDVLVFNILDYYRDKQYLFGTVG